MNYYNDFNQHKKSDTVKWVVAFVLIAVLLFGVAASLFISLRPTENTTVPETENEEVIVEEGTVTDESGNELESGTIYAMSSRMLFSSPTALTSNATDGVTIQATVLPEEAANKLVDWSISFVDSESTWATGKTVTDYVTVTPESDGSTIATVVCLADFGEQIKITVSSRDNPLAKAECSVDYIKRLTNASINLFGVELSNGGSATISSTSTATLNPVGTFEYSNYTKDLTYSVPVAMNTMTATIDEGAIYAIFADYISTTDEFNALSEEEQDIFVQYFTMGRWEYNTSTTKLSTSLTFNTVFQSLYDHYMGVLEHITGGESGTFGTFYKSEFFRFLSSERYSALRITCKISGKNTESVSVMQEDFVGYFTISNQVVSVTLDNSTLEF